MSSACRNMCAAGLRIKENGKATKETYCGCYIKLLNSRHDSHIAHMPA